MAVVPHTRRMVRLIFIFLIVLLPVALVYIAGPWVLLVVAGLAGLVFLLSTRQAEGAEATQGGLLTGYRNTGFGKTGFDKI